MAVFLAYFLPVKTTEQNGLSNGGSVEKAQLLYAVRSEAPALGILAKFSKWSARYIVAHCNIFT